MEQADRLMFVASVLYEGEITRTERMQLCAEIDRIALVVRRMERALDEHVGNAREDEIVAAHARREDALLAERRTRPLPILRLVTGGAA